MMNHSPLKMFWFTWFSRNTCSVCQKRRAVSHELCRHCQERVRLFVVSRRVKRNWEVPTQPSRGDKADQTESRRPHHTNQMSVTIPSSNPTDTIVKPNQF